MAPPFLETNQAGEIYYETSWDEQWSPKYMPPDEVGVEFTDLDREVAQELENFESFLADRQAGDVSKRALQSTGFYDEDAFGPGVDGLVAEAEAEAERQAAEDAARAAEELEAARQPPE